MASFGIFGRIVRAVARDFAAVEARSADHPSPRVDDTAVTLASGTISDAIPTLFVKRPARQHAVTGGRFESLFSEARLDFVGRQCSVVNHRHGQVAIEKVHCRSAVSARSQPQRRVSRFDRSLERLLGDTFSINPQRFGLPVPCADDVLPAAVCQLRPGKCPFGHIALSVAQVELKFSVGVEEQPIATGNGEIVLRNQRLPGVQSPRADPAFQCQLIERFIRT